VLATSPTLRRANEQGETNGNAAKELSAAYVQLRFSQHFSSGRNKGIVRLRAVPHAMRELDEKAPRATLRPPGRTIFELRNLQLRISDCGMRITRQKQLLSLIRIPQSEIRN
jgi:hypothetical protein